MALTESSAEEEIYLKDQYFINPRQMHDINITFYKSNMIVNCLSEISVSDKASQKKLTGGKVYLTL